MSTVNGWGTSFWGWRHSPDGTATATRWFTVFWLPVIPLSRHHIRVLTDFAHDDLVSRTGLHVSQRALYQELAQTPLSLREVGITLLRAYLGLPLILVGPIGLAIVGIIIGEKLAPHTDNSSGPGSAIFVAIAGLSVANFIWQCVLAIRAGRGWHPDALAKIDPFRWGIKRVTRARSSTARRSEP